MKKRNIVLIIIFFLGGLSLNSCAFFDDNKRQAKDIEFYKSSANERNLIDYKGKIKDYTKALSIQSSDNELMSELYSMRAISKGNIGDYQGQIEDFLKAIEFNPKGKNIHNIYAEMARIKQSELKDYNGAIRDYSNALNNNLVNDKYFLIYLRKRALLKTKIKDYKGAIDDYSLALDIKDTYSALDKKVPLINSEISKIYSARALNKLNNVDDIKGVIDDYEKAIEIDPNNSEAYILRGDIAESSESSIFFYTTALEINPNLVEVYYKRANLRSYLKDFEGAIDDYSLAIEVTSFSSPESYLKRGFFIEHYLKDYPRAVADYTKAIEIDPNYFDSYQQRAYTKLYKLKDYKGAIADLKKAIKLAKAKKLNTLNLYRGLAFAKYKSGDRIGACLDSFFWLPSNARGYNNPLDTFCFKSPSNEY